MRVVEIFKSIDGEGVRVGYPVTFIRLEGCNLRCSYCDTKYSYDDAEYTEMSVDDILMEVVNLHCNRITITGGEPLYHEDIYTLVDNLCDAGYEVNIETNGSILLAWSVIRENTIITMDWKCKGSGMTSEMCKDNLKRLRRKDVIKFVVSSEEDLNQARKLMIYSGCKAQVFISPVFGKIEPKEIVEYILSHGENDWRVQVQLHKIIWDPEKRGV